MKKQDCHQKKTDCHQVNRFYVVLILILSVFIGYLWEYFPRDYRVSFPYSDRDMNIMWYVSYLTKDLRAVLLAWGLWIYGIPRKETLLKLGSSVFCVMITFIPINFILFHSTPFHYIIFLFKVVASIIIGFLITYNNDRMRNSTNTRSDYS